MIQTIDVWNIFWTGIGAGIFIGAVIVMVIFAIIIHRAEKNKKVNTLYRGNRKIAEFYTYKMKNKR